MDIKKKHGHGNFISESVRVVDYDTTNNNILVRGSSAFGASGFTISDLTTAIKADPNFTGTGIQLAKNPLVVDFCLIGFAPGHKDDRIVSSEMTWFTDTPPTLNGESGPYPIYIPSAIATNPGIMVYWPIQAIGGTPPTTANGTWPVSPANSIGSGSTQFNYSGLVPAIRNTLTNNIKSLPATFPATISSITNAIIYTHCDSGVNRTGAAVAGYLMCYGSNVSQLSLAPNPQGSPPYTLAKAQAAANAAPPGNDTNPPGGCDIYVAQAYCNYLATGDLDSPLVANCVPNPIPV